MISVKILGARIIHSKYQSIKYTDNTHGQVLSVRVKLKTSARTEVNTINIKLLLIIMMCGILNEINGRNPTFVNVPKFRISTNNAALTMNFTNNRYT